MKTPLVSIIIPVYKVEEYLDRCVESVINQTYKDLEIILVDDGSPDRCPQMCDDWAKKDDRIRVVHQQNKGLSGARNTGIREAKGDWLYFLDSDDYIIPDCISLMMECVEKHPDVEMVYAGAKATKDGYDYFSFEKKELPDYTKDRDWINRTLLLQTVLVMTAWNKLARMAFVLEHNLFFVEGIVHEDDIWNFEMAKHVSRIAVCKHDTYIYVIREGSIMADVSQVYNRRMIELKHLVNRISTEFRARQISFVFQFLSDTFPIEVRNNFQEDIDYVINEIIKRARGRQKLALWMYFKGPRRILCNYHVYGRVINAIGRI